MSRANRVRAGPNTSLECVLAHSEPAAVEGSGYAMQHPESVNQQELPPSFVAEKPPPSFTLHKAEEVLREFIRSQSEVDDTTPATVVLKGSRRRKGSTPQRAWGDDVPRHSHIPKKKNNCEVAKSSKRLNKRRCGKQCRRTQGMSADQVLREMQKRISSRGNNTLRMVKPAAFFRAFPVFFGHGGVSPS